MIRACFTLPKGNDTEHPYALSIFGAWMLRDGIQQYVESTRQIFAHGLFDAYECWLRTETAIKQATKLREWLVEVEPDYLQDSIKNLETLLAELASDKDRFAALLEVEPDTIKDVDALLTDSLAEEGARRAREDDDVPPEMDG